MHDRARNSSNELRESNQTVAKITRLKELYKECRRVYIYKRRNEFDVGNSGVIPREHRRAYRVYVYLYGSYGVTLSMFLSNDRIGHTPKRHCFMGMETSDCSVDNRYPIFGSRTQQSWLSSHDDAELSLVLTRISDVTRLHCVFT